MILYQCFTKHMQMQEGKSPIDLAEGNSEILKILSEARIDSSIELPEDEEQYTAEQRAKKGSKLSLPWIKSDLVCLWDWITLHFYTVMSVIVCVHNTIWEVHKFNKSVCGGAWTV